MSMTREEAIAVIREGFSIIRLYTDGAFMDELTQALSILAPEPRKEPPTKEEVGDEEDCWWFYERRCYIRAKGSEIREDWEDGEQWLPSSALPKGGE